MKYNKSKTYLLPLLISSLNMDKSYLGMISNTYLFDKENRYKNCIIIEHLFENSSEFMQFEHSLLMNSLFIDMYNTSDKVYYVFKFPEEYMPEYNYFINNMYSKFGEDAKIEVKNFGNEAISKTTSNKRFLSKIDAILHKKSWYKKEIEDKVGQKLEKDSELGEFVDKIDETIDFKKIYHK